VFLNLRHENEEAMLSTAVTDAAHDVGLAETRRRLQDGDFRPPVWLVLAASALDRLFKAPRSVLVNTGDVEGRVEDIRPGNAIIAEGVRK